MSQGAGGAEPSVEAVRQQFFAAVGHHQAGRFAEAEALYRAIIGGGWRIAEAHNNLGTLLQQRGDDAAALAAYREAVAINPADAGALCNLGNVLREQGKPEEAEAAYRRALSVKPDHAESNNNFGMMLSERGQHAEALACYRAVLAANPRFVDALNNAAVATRRSGDTREAIALWRRAIALKPNSVEAHVYLADTLADLGAIDEAREHARLADQLEVPPRPALCFALGVALARCGLIDAARSRLRQCASGDPTDRYGARLALASLGEGIPPGRASAAFIDRLYAICADRWDNPTGPHPYRGAELVAERVVGEGLDVLDIGCGTGLVGVLVRQRARTLVGVDLSGVMLERARAKLVYDELHRGDMVLFMQGRPQICDFVTSAATLIHFGDLEPVFKAANIALRPGGRFVFTVFPHDQDAAVSVAALDGLGQGGCFLHGPGFIAATAAASGLVVDAIETAIHEYKNGQPLEALVVVLRKA
ncbi:MAG TPA: tetratricopeptide repeat protein [Xanthobacteraceae bacterium]|nr:tetratricopeptide repeat protein [Xanthobacteraceae bacterium]